MQLQCSSSVSRIVSVLMTQHVKAVPMVALHQYCLVLMMLLLCDFLQHCGVMIVCVTGVLNVVLGRINVVM